MSMEEWDAIAGTVAALGGSAMGGASVSLSATGAGARSVTGNSTAGSGGAGAAVTAPFALPAIDEVGTSSAAHNVTQLALLIHIQKTIGEQ